MSTPMHAATTPAIVRRDVVADGLRLRVAEAGQGPAVLLLHGLAASHAIWEHVFATLAARWHVVAPDLPGHGASAKPDAPYSIDFYAGVLRSLGRELGLAEVCVVGSSLGGRIAIELGAYYPGWVRAIALAAPARDYGPWLRPAWAAVSRFASPGLMRVGLVRGLERAFFELDTAGHATRRRILAESLAADDYPAHARAVVRSIGGALAAEHAVPTRLRQPVLVTWGRHDRLVPLARSAALLRQIPQASFHVFERCGHVPMLEQPARFAAVLCDFLDRVDGQGRGAAGGA